MQNVVEVEGLVKRYGSLTAVDQISFTVREHEIFGLLGPNGAGKTTTLECIEGLRQPDGGQIRVLGLDICAQREELRGKIGVQIEDGMPFSHLTVKENLDLAASVYPRPSDTEQLIAWIGLEEQKHSLAAKLSRGQRQRLTVVMALVGNPSVVSLDEPTLGFDPKARRLFWDLLDELRREGKSIILSTHVMEEAEKVCDRVAIIDQGKLLALDTPRALISRFEQQTAIECKFEEGSEVNAQTLEKLPAVTEVKTLQETFVIYSEEVVKTLVPLIAMAQDDPVRFKGLNVRHATLEDVFISLTGGRLQS